MTTQKQTLGKGRPQLSPVERELREAARRLKDLNDIRSEFNQLLSLDERTDEEAEEIQELADKRREICRAIDRVSDEVKAAREAGDKRREAEGKEARKALYESLNDLPELGYTHEDWKKAPSEMKKKELGRPKLRIEQQLNRAEAAFNEQETILRKVEEEHGEEPSRIRDHIQQAVQPNVGRPKLSPIGRLDRDLIKTEEEIEHIESGKAQEEQDAMIQARMEELGLDDPSELPGRPPVPVADRLARLEEKRDEILGKIRQHERKMSESELLDREIDVTKLRMRSLNRKIKKEGDASGSLAKQHSALKLSLDKLEASQRKMMSDGQGYQVKVKAKAEKPKASVTKEKQPEVVSVRQDELNEAASAAKKAAQKEHEKRDTSLRSMEATLDSLLEELNIEVSSSEKAEPKRSRLKDRLLAKASNE